MESPTALLGGIFEVWKNLSFAPNEIDSLNSALNESEEKVQSLLRKNKTLPNEKDSLQNKSNSMPDKNKSLRNENDSLQKKNRS